MPYASTHDLPPNVRNHVPEHGQEIYRAAYNSAYEEYGHDEERAHRVAWAAVKDQYEKDSRSGQWRPKANANDVSKRDQH